MLKELKLRRSIRSYLPKQVEEEKLLELLRAAMQAPTARNLQTWRFHVITNRNLLDSMTKIQPYTGMMKSAPCAILVTGDLRNAMDEGYVYLDGAAAIENILIEAVHQGLGTCWCGIWPNEDRVKKFKERFQLPSEQLPVGIVAVGYPAEEIEMQDRFDPEKITYIQ